MFSMYKRGTKLGMMFLYKKKQQEKSGHVRPHMIYQKDVFSHLFVLLNVK